MSQKSKENLENEFIGILLSALKKGMTADDFFNVAESTLDHLRGRLHSDTIEKVMNNTASAEEVERFVTSLGKKSPD